MKFYRNSFIIVIFGLTMVQCNSQKIMNSLSEIHFIEPAKKHYLELQKISKVPEKENIHLDSIQFPKKSNEMLIKLIPFGYLDKTITNTLIKELQPPANSSLQTQAEVTFLLKLQNNRTPKEVEESLRLHEIVYFPIVGMRSDKDLFFECYEIFGNQFDPSKYPSTKELLKKSMRDMRIMEFTAKNNILRARPRQLSSELKPLKKMNSSSFASGHTLWAYLQAYIFSELIPEKRQAFLDLAYKLGYSREILGVHYPSDEEASRILAYKMLTLMLKNNDFQTDFYKAKKEWE